jgi:DNA polymerase I-like protein with 3'-5' exonuclease and polymerase domains/uracil-DNA glycosylase
MIPPRGSDSAEIMLVGDFATKQDVNNNQCLSGYYETSLRGLFARAGDNFASTYKTLLIKKGLTYYGLEKKRRTAAIREAATAEDLPILVGEITDLRPKIIIPLGELSFSSLTGLRGISKFRGSILPLEPQIQSQIGNDPIGVAPIIGPRELQIDPSFTIITELDIRKALTASRNVEDYLREDYKIFICRKADDLRTYIDRWMKSATVLVFDIETQFGVPICISLCFSREEAIVVPFNRGLAAPDRIMIWHYLARILSSNIPKVNQNIAYDIQILERFGFKVNNATGDTMLAASLLYPEFKKNLGFLVSLYTNMRYFKDEGKEFDPKTHSFDRLLTYCGKDTVGTRRVHDSQMEELKEKELFDFYTTRTMPLMILYKDQFNANGLLIDDTRRTYLRTKYETILETKTMFLEALVGRAVNPRSNKVIGAVIYDELKFPPRRLATGAYNTEEEVLEELAVLHSDDCNDAVVGPLILRTILVIRKLYKLLELINTPVHCDLRLRGRFNLAGTNTGRSSCSKSGDRSLVVSNITETRKPAKVITVELGRTLQNIGKHGFKVGGETYGKDVRSMFVPTPGYVFVEGDLSQAEARVDAVLAEDFDFLLEFDRKPGVHCLTASWVYECDPSEIKKGTEEYFIGKQVRHAGERNMFPPRLALMIQRELPFCEKILTLFHNRQPKIREVFHGQIKEAVKTTRTLRTPHGRIRDFFGAGHEMYNEAISFIPQATVGDQTKDAALKTSYEMPDVRFIVEAHDGILAEVKKEQIPQYVETFARHIQSPIDFTNCTLSRDCQLVIPAEFETSETNWEELKKYEPL